jgi:CheY-like chemotaxis protein
MNSKRILIVDDEPSVTRDLKLALEDTLRYEVWTENDPRHATAAAREFRPDLILLDVIMPGLDGCEIAAHLHADPESRDIPIVFLTALATNDDTGGQLMLAGSTAYFAKPVMLGQLMQGIEQILSTPVTRPNAILHHL